METEIIESTDICFHHFFGIDLAGPGWNFIVAGYAVSPLTNKMVLFADEYDKLSTHVRVDPSHITWMETEDTCGIHEG